MADKSMYIPEGGLYIASGMVFGYFISNSNLLDDVRLHKGAMV